MIELPRTNLDQTVQEETASRLASVRRELRRDLRFLMFYLSPHLEGFRDDNAWYAANFRLRINEIQRMRSDLLRSGLWVQGPGAEIQVQTARLSLADNDDIKANVSRADFMTMITQALMYLDEKDCWANAYTVVTSHEVRDEFISEVKQALEKFLERSKDAKGETTLTWAHVSINTLQALKTEGDL